MGWIRRHGETKSGFKLQHVISDEHVCVSVEETLAKEVTEQTDGQKVHSSKMKCEKYGDKQVQHAHTQMKRNEKNQIFHCINTKRLRAFQMATVAWKTNNWMAMKYASSLSSEVEARSLGL